MDTYDVYDKIRSVGASEGWSGDKQAIILCQFIESMKPYYMLDEFLKGKQAGAS